jgi:hypothetical protein
MRPVRHRANPATWAPDPRRAGWKLLTVLVLAVGLLGSVSSSASAATTVNGSEYTVGFNGTGSVDSTYSEQEGDSSFSGHQTGSWTIADDNEPALWLPSAYSSAEEGAMSSGPAFHEGLDSNGVLQPVTASLSETGMTTDDQGNPVPYSCSASSIYDNGVGTVSAGAVLGHLTIGTSYSQNPMGGVGRGFVAGHPDPTDPNGVAFDAQLPCQPNSGAGGRFEYPEGGDTIGYAAAIPFTSVGQATINLPASDESKITESSQSDDCAAQIATCSVHFAISGTYTLTKVCDGTITYSGDEADGTCGTGPGPSPGPGGGERPNTKITKHSVNKHKHAASFAFKSTGAKATSFQCALVKHKQGHKQPKPRYSSCRSPKTYKHLAHGSYTFYVRAVSSAGPDLTPATANFRL